MVKMTGVYEDTLQGGHFVIFVCICPFKHKIQKRVKFITRALKEGFLCAWFGQVNGVLLHECLLAPKTCTNDKLPCRCRQALLSTPDIDIAAVCRVPTIGKNALTK